MSHTKNLSQPGRAKSAGLDTSVTNTRASTQSKSQSSERRSSVKAHKGRLHLKSHAEYLYGKLAHDARSIVPTLRRRTDRRRVVSQETTNMRLKYILRMLKILMQEGYQLKSIHELGERHVRRTMLWMVESGCTRKYMVSFFTQVRHFFEEGLNKKGALKHVTSYIGEGVISPSNATRSRAISSHKDEDGNSLDPQDFIRQARGYDERAGLCCELALYMGLRFNETLALQPNSCMQANGKVYVRATGAKNGRAREVDLELVPELREKALATIEKMKLLCPNKNDTIYQRMSLRLAKDRLRTALEVAGLTKRHSGVTFHGFRHEWFQTMWRSAGFVVPLDGPALPKHTNLVQLGLQVLAKQLLIESAGHSDHHKCGAYLGGHYKQLQAAGVSKRKLGRAYALTMDIPYGDVQGIEARRADLHAVEARETTMEALEERILENFLNGTQHRRLMHRTLAFSAPAGIAVGPQRSP